MLCVFRVVSKSLGWKCWFPKISSSSRWLYSVCMLVFEGVNRLINAKMASNQKIKQSFPQVHFSLKPPPSIYQHIIYIYLLICFPLHLNKNMGMPSKMGRVGMECFVEPWTAPKSQIFKMTERLLRNSEIEVYLYIPLWVSPTDFGPQGPELYLKSKFPKVTLIFQGGYLYTGSLIELKWFT